MAEDTYVSQELYVIDSHSIGGNLWQSYHRLATPDEVAERAGIEELNHALEVMVQRNHELERSLHSLLGLCKKALQVFVSEGWLDIEADLEEEIINVVGARVFKWVPMWIRPRTSQTKSDPKV
jgi:hypothetical protein